MSEDAGELRLFLEEICCELCRLDHVERDALLPEVVETLREVRLDRPGAYADIRVKPGGGAPYFVEIKWGYAASDLLERLARKYSRNPDPACSRLIVVSDLAGAAEWPKIEAALRARIDPSLAIEAWSEGELLARFERCFGLKLDSLDRGRVRAIRDSISGAEWKAAFGDADDRLAPTLLWHFSSWTLRRLKRDRGLSPDRVLVPGTYPNVAIVMADICSFSSYVRDTRDPALVRQSLTAFYSQARQAIVETGGMIDKFVGDEVIGLYGFPDNRPGFAEDALRGARRLVDIGNSVSEHWQGHIDRVQKSGGVHIGIALGDLNLMPLRAFSSAHHGFIGDPLNMTARLMGSAGPSEMFVSNGFYQALSASSRAHFEEQAPLEGKNVGLIKSWKLPPEPVARG